MTDYNLVEKFLDSGKYPPVCPYLKGQGSSYYCLVGGEGTKCPREVVSGEVYACENSIFKSRYHRLLNERSRR